VRKFPFVKREMDGEGEGTLLRHFGDWDVSLEFLGRHVGYSPTT